MSGKTTDEETSEVIALFPCALCQDAKSQPPEQTDHIANIKPRQMAIVAFYSPGTEANLEESFAI